MTASPQGIPFIKMHGAGNDFVIIDARTHPFTLNEEQRVLMANRRYGVGCDQLVVLKPSHNADIFMQLFNADGGEVGACGNATRCVAWLVMMETEKESVTVETLSGILTCEYAGPSLIKVNMGAPRFAPEQIPLIGNHNILAVHVPESPLGTAVALSMGNPHAVFFVPAIEDVALHVLGPEIEHSSLFPERTNVGVVEVKSPEHILLRVWERGAGETLACGTGACAAMVAARLKGLVEKHVRVSVPGGDLLVDWEGQTIENPPSVWMTGPVAMVFSGVWWQN